MITGHEPNIVARMEAAEQAKRLAKQRAAIARDEIAQQKKFAGWLRKEQYAGRLYFINPRSDKATTIARGHPDFTIWLANGHELRMEFKAPGGRRSPEQEKVAALLLSLGHPVLFITGAAQAQAVVELHMTFQNEHPNRTKDVS